MKPRDRRFLAAAVVFLLILSITQTAVSGSKAAEGVGKLLSGFEKTTVGGFFIKLGSMDTLHFAQRLVLVAAVWLGSGRIMDDLENNFVRYIVANPDIHHSMVHGFIRYFVGILYPLYILAIIVTGFYILFIPGSPRGRARAKSLLGKLVVGIVLVSISPYLMGSLLGLTGHMTEAIVGDPDAPPTGYAKITAEEIVSSIRVIRNLIVLQNAFNLVFQGQKFFGIFPRNIGGISWWLHTLVHMVPLEIEHSWILPFLLFAILIILSVYAVIAFRYFMVLLWGMLLPIAIFFYSFEFTKGLGRTMIEQTLLWSFLQVFYAIIVVVFALGIITVPADMYSKYGLGFSLDVMENYGVSTELRGLWGVLGGGNAFFISIFTVGGLFLLFVGPILLLTFFQRLLPP